MAKTKEPAPVVKARSDAYTGMLAISFLALVGCCVLLYLDYDQYPAGKPSANPTIDVPGTTGKQIAAPGKAAPEPVPEPEKKDDKKDEKKDKGMLPQENRPGEFVVDIPLIIQDDNATYSGQPLFGDESIKAFSLDPVIAATDMEGASAKFDERWISSMKWQAEDQKIQQSCQSLNNADYGSFNNGIFKPLPTGAIAGLAYQTNYTPAGTQIVPVGNVEPVNPLPDLPAKPNTLSDPPATPRFVPPM